MTYNSALLSLIEQIGLTDSHFLIDWKTVQQWPSGALDGFTQTGLLATASPAKSIECNACENHCYMDVLRQTGGKSINRAFIVCDDPVMQSQMGKIEIPIAHLQQWKTSFIQLARVITGLLGFDADIEYKSEKDSIRLGMLKSKGGRRWVSLFNQPLELDINGFKTPVNELLFIDGGEIVIDTPRINDLLESKPLCVSKAYTPSTDKREAGKVATQAKYQDWQDQYASLKVKHPTRNKTWYSVQIAKLPIAQGADSETIRKHLK